MKEVPITAPVALCCDTIGDQDRGIARPIVDAEISKALNDLADRGEEDGKPRKVVIEIEMVHHDGLVITNVSAQAKLPPHRSKSTLGKLRMKSKGEHELLFQPEDFRPDQPHFNQPE